MPTIAEAITLWIILSGVGIFFFGLRFILSINVLILMLIIAGFFIGIGIEFLNFLT